MKSSVKYAFLSLLLGIICQMSCWSLACASTLLAWVMLGGHYTLYLMYHTLSRDLKTAWRVGHLLYINIKAKRNDMSVGDKFQVIADRYPDRPMVTCCGESESDTSSLTYRQVLHQSRQVARYFLARGYVKGDVVALLMETRADYVTYWLGLSYIGVIPALINTHVKQKGLLHSINIVDAKAVIVSSELESVLVDVKAQLEDIEVFSVDECHVPNWIDLIGSISSLSTDPLETKYVGYSDSLFYIYTSGTTGLPKAAIIKHSRFMFSVYALYCLCIVRENDVIYSPLPLYHSAAGTVTMGAALLEGVRMVTRKKFSARMFWSDCVAEGVTVTQYIGEIARYVYSAGEKPAEHRVRMMFGNGMRKDLWLKYMDKFGVGEICEFYGSTEGNCSVGNITGQVGSAGAISVLFPWIFPLDLIRVDAETGEPLRDNQGLCIPCQVGEPGELVGRIDKGHPVRDFHGYADKSATKKKVMVDVWKKGDMCFRSGDIFVKDEFGNLYFKDRAGDTFRWKGENVSTLEVELVVSQILKLKDCVVYGVEVAGNEGKAGMVAIPAVETQDMSDSQQQNSIDLVNFHKQLTDKLPAYARPLFVRFVEKIDMTATYKLKKRDLQREGIDPHVISDPLFMLDVTSGKYVPITEELHQNIANKNVRF